MPKKHTPSYQNAKPKPTSHSSLASKSKDSPIGPNNKAATVNERLQELRISQRPSVTPSASGSISNFTNANNGQRLLTPAHRRSGRIAGPPPPRSWLDPRIVAQGLESSRHAPKRSGDESGPDYTNWLPSPILPDQPLPDSCTLRAMALRLLAKTMSKQISEYPDLVYELTTRMRAELVAIMASSPPWASSKLTKSKLFYLFGPLQCEDGSWISGGEGITHISLGTVIGDRLDYADLSNCLRRSTPIEQDYIPESWDDGGNSEIPPPSSALQRSDGEPDSNSLDFNNHSNSHSIDSLWLPIFPSLTHLSLARPSSPCWGSLLECAAQDCFANLTHLDLSYWPAPKLRNLTHDGKTAPFQPDTARADSEENNEKEEIRVLNRLGKACRKLTWLGLEGCEGWLRCLTAIHDKPSIRPRSRFDMDAGHTKDELIRVDWAGIWRGLKTVKVVQSWVPLPFLNKEVQHRYPGLQTRPSANSTLTQWWTNEGDMHRMEQFIAEWRIQAGLTAIKFEMSPIESWIELEVRTINARQAIERWKKHPDLGGVIDL